jgi:deoxyribonuclease-4
MDKNILIGAHTSIAGGVFNALIDGQKIGATTIQMFTSNQKQWKGKELTSEAIAKWEEAKAATGITEVMSHDSYLINLGCPEKENLEKSREAFKLELARCQKLKISYLNFHPGAALKEPVERCLDTIVESLLQMEPYTHLGPTRLLLEATAGQGSSVGYLFEHLGYIVSRVKSTIPIGVCIDTCHIFAAGYDIRTQEGWDKTLQDFDEKVGLQHLYAFHLNDSLKGLGSRVDRHADLGTGLIGIESFKVVMNNPLTCHLPKYLETPGGMQVWGQEIELLKQFARM